MKRILSAKGARAATAIALALTSSSVFAGSIQQPGLTTGMPEGFGRTPGLYSATMRCDEHGRDVASRSGS